MKYTNTSCELCYHIVCVAEGMLCPAVVVVVHLVAVVRSSLKVPCHGSSVKSKKNGYYIILSVYFTSTVGELTMYVYLRNIESVWQWDQGTMEDRSMTQVV